MNQTLDLIRWWGVDLDGNMIYLIVDLNGNIKWSLMGT
jgi:hypothetical protein